jgi:hypothetical protein
MRTVKLPHDVYVVGFAWLLIQLWAAIPHMIFLGPDLAMPSVTGRRSLNLACALYLAFRLWPSRSTSRVLDVVIGIVAFVCATAVLIVKSVTITPGLPQGLAHEFAAWIGLILLLEATRRVLGLPALLLSVSLFLVGIYVLLKRHGVELPGAPVPSANDQGHSAVLEGIFSFGSAAIETMRQTILSNWFSNEGVFGLFLGLSESTIFLFVLLGAIAQQARAGDASERLYRQALFRIRRRTTVDRFPAWIRNRALMIQMGLVALLLMPEGSILTETWKSDWLGFPAVYSQILVFGFVALAVTLPFMGLRANQHEIWFARAGDGLWRCVFGFVIVTIILAMDAPAIAMTVTVFMIGIPIFLAWGYRETKKVEPAINQVGSSLVIVAVLLLAASMLMAVNYLLATLFWKDLAVGQPPPLILAVIGFTIFCAIYLTATLAMPRQRRDWMRWLVWFIPLHVAFASYFAMGASPGRSATTAVATALPALALQRLVDHPHRFVRMFRRDLFLIGTRCVSVMIVVTITAAVIGAATATLTKP